jgi:hypothetical protein
MAVAKSKATPKIEFPFVLEALARKKPLVKKMFGCTALYEAEKILLIFRLKKEHTDDNGIWIATVPEHHESLRRDFPMIRDIRIFGNGPTTWQNLPLESPGFEESAEKICELILKGDVRIGKVPGVKKKKAPAAKKAKKSAKSSRVVGKKR